MSEQWTDESESSESEDDVIIETDDESESDQEVEQAPPPPPTTPEPEAPKSRPRGRPPKPIVEKVKGKRKMSEAQLAALAKGRAKRDAGRLERMTEKQKVAEVKKKRRDEMTVKKAVKIKKKEVIEEAALLLSSEDEMDDLEIKQVKRVVAKRKGNTKKKTAAPKQVLKDKSQIEAPQYVFY